MCQFPTHAKYNTFYLFIKNDHQCFFVSVYLWLSEMMVWNKQMLNHPLDDCHRTLTFQKNKLLRCDQYKIKQL